jgi:hypothetical protein
MKTLRKIKFVIEYIKYWMRIETLSNFGGQDKIINTIVLLNLLLKKSMRLTKVILTPFFKIMEAQHMVLTLKISN